MIKLLLAQARQVLPSLPDSRKTPTALYSSSKPAATTPNSSAFPRRSGLAYGSKVPIWDSDHIWNFSARATDLARIDIPRGKITGGSSGVNGAQFLRGVREDYDRWAEWGNEEWSFENVFPYFKRMESDQGLP